MSEGEKRTGRNDLAEVLRRKGVKRRALTERGNVAMIQALTAMEAIGCDVAEIRYSEGKVEIVGCFRDDAGDEE
ncbi:MAG: hypothetical protein FWE09_00050 [Treponema sp.]|nr:hypothetical protein [Treponema sp.]